MYITYPGTQKRCYFHIVEAVQLLRKIVENWDASQGEIINVGNPLNEIDMKTLALKIYQSWNNTLVYKYNKKPYLRKSLYTLIDGEELYGKGYEDSERRLFCSKKLERITGWKPNDSLDWTIQKVVEDAIEAYA